MKSLMSLRSFRQFTFWTCASAAFLVPAAHAATLPSIYAFNFSGTSTINAGDSVTLNWSVSNGASVSISPGIGAVSGTEVTVTPAATTTYTLTASNLAGSVSKSRKITVIVPPGLRSFLQVRRPPRQRTLPDQILDQRFELRRRGATSCTVTAVGVVTAL